ncbi:HNH endonuclease [Neobacillus pocheonensis]|uniref:HNH endonuclease n=1 Tax=Neobacillus pocheonensis TaxID=363869 RepID=UPI003D26A668
MTSTTIKNTICQDCLKQKDGLKTIKKNTVNQNNQSSVKERLINEIIEMVIQLEVEEIPGFEDIDFTKVSTTQLTNLRNDELSLLLDNLYEMVDKNSEEDIGEELEPELINPLEIIRKYKTLLDKKAKKNKPVEKWRLNIPKFIKTIVKNWRTESIHSIYEKSKIIMRESNGQLKEEIMDFVCDLSEIIFEEPVVEKISLDDIGRVEDWVLSRVEMIILPQLEVLDLLENNQGILILDDSWTKDLTQALIKEVHERDDWHCFICNDDNRLEIHQIISTESEKIYHKDNLITLCSSCKDAVNTMSVNKAFTQCLNNFIENY